jgi:hypothetical protein
MTARIQSTADRSNTISSACAVMMPSLQLLSFLARTLQNSRVESLRTRAKYQTQNLATEISQQANGAGPSAAHDACVMPPSDEPSTRAGRDTYAEYFNSTSCERIQRYAEALESVLNHYSVEEGRTAADLAQIFDQAFAYEASMLFAYDGYSAADGGAVTRTRDHQDTIAEPSVQRNDVAEPSVQRNNVANLQDGATEAATAAAAYSGSGVAKRVPALRPTVLIFDFDQTVTEEVSQSRVHVGACTRTHVCMLMRADGIAEDLQAQQP